MKTNNSSHSKEKNWFVFLLLMAGCISLLHQQPPVINQPSTCLISTYVCFLSIDILTVIILFYFIKFNKSKDSLNSLKEKRNLFYFFLIEGNWWIVDLWLLPPSLKKLISSNYGVVGYRFDAQRLTQSIHQISLQSHLFSCFLLSFFNKHNSFHSPSFVLSAVGREDKSKWREEKADLSSCGICWKQWSRPKPTNESNLKRIAEVCLAAVDAAPPA